MADFSADAFTGLVARLDELIAMRPAGGESGFAPARKVRTHQNGGYRSSFHGRGMEFDEVRAYQPGDDIRTIDWRVTARTGRTHTKLFQEERERPVLILLDARAFMRFGTRVCFKSVAAARAAALLTWVSLDGGDRVGGLVMAPSGLAFHPPQRSRARVMGLLKAMTDATTDRFDVPPTADAPEPVLAEAISRLRRAARPGTLVFLVSDFHDFDAAAARELARLSLQCQITNVLVFDLLEASAPRGGAFPFSDGTVVGRVAGESNRVRAAYARRFAERHLALSDLSRQRGMRFVTLATGQDPADILRPERARRAGTGGAAA